MLTTEEGKIIQFLEKPTWSQVFSDTVNTGIYVLEPEALELVAPGQKVDFSQDLYPELLKRGAPLYGFVAPGYWSDVGNLEVYRQVQQDCLDGKVKLDLPIPQKGQIYVEEGVQIHSSAVIEGPVYIGKGSRIGPHAYVGPYSVLGAYSQVDANASLKRSLLWPAVKVGKGTRLRGCICAKNAFVEHECEIYEGAVLGERVRLGSFSTISPNTKVWPAKVIPSGTKLDSSLVWGSQEQKPIFTKHGMSGDIRGNLTPELLIQFGLSYAAFLGERSRVLVTSDFSKTANLAKGALVVGLRAGGLDTHDGGEVTGRLTRFAVQELSLDGALHVFTNPQNENTVFIECWNSHGRLLSKTEQRKIEGILSREDYPRFSGEDIGDFIQVAGLKKRYLRSLAKAYFSGSPGFKVGLVMEPHNDPLGEMVRDFLRLSGYTVVSEDVKGLPTIVVRDQTWFIQDEQGHQLSDQDWWKGFIRALKSRNKKTVAIPVNLSETVAKEARNQGLEVQLTKMEPLFWMEAATELGNNVGEGQREVFPHIEPLASIGEILSLISTHGVALCPEGEGATHLKTAKVPCTWSEKGRVMRKLIENADPERTSFHDGLKEYRDSGWTLVIPDDDEPVFRLYSEAGTEEEATDLIEHYTNLIRRYEKEEK